MALIIAAEVITLAVVRNIDPVNILAIDILTAERDYIEKPLGTDLYNAIVTNADDAYTSFITTYVKPVLAIGVISNIWNRLRLEITDRGINAFNGDGITTPQNEAADAALFEYRQRLSGYIGAMINYCDEQYPTLFDSTLDYQYKEVTYYSAQPQRRTAL